MGYLSPPGGRSRPKRYGPVRAPYPRRVRPLGYQTGWQPPGEAILRQASFWMDARDLSSSTQQSLPNRADGGATTAQMGSTTGADTSDPVRLPHSGTSYLWFPGSSGNGLTTPDSDPLDLSTGIEFVARAAAGAWKPSTSNVLLSKFSAYEMVLSNSNLQLTVGAASYFSTAPSSLADGSAGWLKFTWRSSDGRIQFFQAADQSSEPATWTQVGTDVVGPTTPIAANSAGLGIGARNNGTFPYQGTLSRLILRNGIGGTTVLDIDTAVNPLGQSSFACSTGQTVTVNRATSGLVTTVVTRPVLVADGVDDRIQLPAVATPTLTRSSGAATALALLRKHPQPSATFAVQRLISFESAANNGAWLQFSRTTGQISAAAGDGTTSATSIAPAVVNDSTLRVAGAVWSAGSVQAYVSSQGLASGVSYASIASDPILAQGSALARGDAAANVLSGEILTVATWNRALTQTELDTVSAYLLA